MSQFYVDADVFLYTHRTLRLIDKIPVQVTVNTYCTTRSLELKETKSPQFEVFNACVYSADC
jgi:hypothetical protein